MLNSQDTVNRKLVHNGVETARANDGNRMHGATAGQGPLDVRLTIEGLPGDILLHGSSISCTHRDAAATRNRTLGSRRGGAVIQVA